MYRIVAGQFIFFRALSVYHQIINITSMKYATLFMNVRKCKDIITQNCNPLKSQVNFCWKRSSSSRLQTLIWKTKNGSRSSWGYSKFEGLLKVQCDLPSFLQSEKTFFTQPSLIRKSSLLIGKCTIFQLVLDQQASYNPLKAAMKKYQFKSSRDFTKNRQHPNRSKYTWK